MAKAALVSSIVVTLAVYNCWFIYLALIPHNGSSRFSEDFREFEGDKEAPISNPLPDFYNSSILGGSHNGTHSSSNVHEQVPDSNSIHENSPTADDSVMSDTSSKDEVISNNTERASEVDSSPVTEESVMSNTSSKNEVMSNKTETASEVDSSPVTEESLVSDTSSANEVTSNKTETASEIDSSPITGECDIAVGKWIPDTKPPLYTNETCNYIQPSQNCMMNGRPDRGYLNWRWKPSECELDYLDPAEFLQSMSNKKMVFIGDSIARNHMQSLLCALAQVEEPEKVYFDTKDKVMKWGFPSYNFSLDHFWSPFLAQHDFIDEIYHIHLDKPEQVWASQIHEYDVAILSSGYWYFRPSVYYEKKKMLGCNPRSHLNYTIFDVLPAYRLAHRDILKYMAKRFRGYTILRTITVDHFEYGSWNTGGLCNRTSPYSDSEATELPWMSNEMHKIQVEEFQHAVEIAEKRGGGWRLKLLNVTYSAFMRPDGHPNNFRVQPANERPQNDCLHWCLPGPIDTWNQMIAHTLQNLQLKSSTLRQFGKFSNT